MTLRDALGWLLVGAAALYALVAVPTGGELTTMINGSIYASYAILALSLALIWGYAGILSFGQAAFFGLAGYVYAVAGLNLESTPLAAVIAVAAAAGFAALLGYFMFWGRISDVYLGVITLTVSLILYRFINQTAGEEWTIGAAPLGGFNGIPSTPILAPPGHPDEPFLPEQIYVLAVGALLACYVICKLAMATRFGRAVVAIRENEGRAELLGYDTRRYKLGIFTLGGAIAGVGGVLFANSVFVSPNMFSLQTNGQVIIWVIVGGLGTFAGPVIGCFLLMALSTWLGSLDAGPGFAVLDPNLVMGVVLTLCVLGLRQGLLPTALALGERLLAKARGTRGRGAAELGQPAEERP
ncbi:branched-chain amino acid transport system permease protein [Methylopila capsulata]|uniref:Branched-chain amino acid ABC transporter permease n=1 Tax=Methylopila capsulata TaxID=61654 RepID=A0A9W6MRV9_9HYPH|nr:branched-chain amino acid ABC transporter permease [Methylopila capsulata]MBM7850370.1 branched-chain amino acid transport system permease protein [Methylopila capsulata]GLK55663.1 branched-chain amino acid ABC transporter permease [Methylopila capsulata]